MLKIKKINMSHLIHIIDTSLCYLSEEKNKYSHAKSAYETLFIVKRVVLLNFILKIFTKMKRKKYI